MCTCSSAVGRTGTSAAMVRNVSGGRRCRHVFRPERSQRFVFKRSLQGVDHRVGSPDWVARQSARSGPVSTQISTGRRAGARLVRRIAAVVAACAVLLVVAPGVAAAAPVDPSDAQISAAREQQDAAAQQVGALSAQLATAQAGVDAVRARSAIALDAFQGKQAEYEAAQATADAAAAA